MNGVYYKVTNIQEFRILINAYSEGTGWSMDDWSSTLGNCGAFFRVFNNKIQGWSKLYDEWYYKDNNLPKGYLHIEEYIKQLEL